MQSSIKWIDGRKLSDLDDDIAILYDSWTGMQATTSSLEQDAKVGLYNNIAKTIIKMVDNWTARNGIQAGGEEI